MAPAGTMPIGSPADLFPYGDQKAQENAQTVYTLRALQI